MGQNVLEDQDIMELKNIRIKSYRTIGNEEQYLDLPSGLTIVGTNNSGKTNILKAIELLFTGYENIYGYKREQDLPFKDTASRTSLTANFQGDPDGKDKLIYDTFEELLNLLGNKRGNEINIPLNLQFSSTSSPTYQIFPNAKKPQDQNKKNQYSQKQKLLVNSLISKFSCHYIPSEKSVKDLYNELLVPFLRKVTAKQIEGYLEEIKKVLAGTANRINEVLVNAGLSSKMAARFEIPNASLEDFISGFDFKLTDHIETSIFRKGMGIQSTALMAAFLWITEEEILQDKTVIWLLEEPESYLHPGLSINCGRILNQLQEKSLLVTTTHSLNFVPYETEKIIGTELVFGKTKINNYKKYIEATKSIRESLGIRFSDYYNLAKHNIFVEGESDKDYLEWILQIIPNNVNGQDFSWSYLRSHEILILDFGGVKHLSGFLRTTYEFISKERVVVSIFDGDEAGNKEIKDIQKYFGNKQIGFNSNINYISLPNGFAIEGLFPDEWIIQLHNEHKSWFKNEFSVDMDGKLQFFNLEDNHKKDFAKKLKTKAQEQENYEWATKWIKLCNLINSALENLAKKINV